MKKHLTVLHVTFVAVIILFSCTPETIPIKGTYPTAEMYSNESPDSIWVKIGILMARNGLWIKRIDTRSGLFVSEKTSFIRVYTVEDAEGRVQDPEAWVVLPRFYVKEKEWKAKTIYSKWNFQIGKAENGKTKIKIDPVIICTFYPNMFTKIETHGQSTGKLEELLNGLIQ